MAIDAGKVVAMLELDTSQFSGGISSAQKLLRAWGSETASVGDKLKATGQAMSGIGKSMSTAVTLPLVALGTAAVKTFTGFDDAMRQVRATMNASEEDTQKLTEAAQQMGATTRYSASESANALNYLALAGYDAEQAIEALPTVLRLAQAGGLDLAYASDLVTDSMSALGLAMDDMDTFADQLALTSQKSNTNVAQLGEAILTVGGTAKTLAGGTAELNAELGILADNGIKGAEGGTHLRNVILALQNPTEDGAKALAKYTSGVYDAQGNMRSLDAIMQELNASMATMTEAERQTVIADIFNKTDLAAAQALLAGCGDRFGELVGMIEDSSGAAQAMAEVMEGGIGGSFRSLGSAAEGLAIAFGESLAPTVQKVADFVTNLTRTFTSLPTGVRETIVQVAAFAAAVGPVLLIGGKLVTMFGALTTAMTGPVGWITLGIAGVAALIAALKRLDSTRVRPGITQAELEEYKLPDDIDLGTQTVEFETEVKRRGQSAYDQIVAIMNDGLPETEEEYNTMAAGVNNVIDASMEAIEKNYNLKMETLKNLLDTGVIDEKEYQRRTQELTKNTDDTKAALQGDADEITEYVAALVAANAPMTEAQLAYLQELIDKLVETSTAAGIAADAALNGYELAYKRVSGGIGVDGDIETGAQYIETVIGQKIRDAQEAEKQSQADLAAELAKYAPGSAEYDEVLEKSAKDLEYWQSVYKNLSDERAAMYANMAAGSSGIDAETMEAAARYSEMLEIQKEYNDLFASRNEMKTDEDWDAYEAKQAELDSRLQAMGIDNLTLAISNASDDLADVDVSKLKDIMGYFYANGEDMDATQLETVQGLVAAWADLVGIVGGVDSTAMDGIDMSGLADEITDAKPAVDAAITTVTDSATSEADVSDEMEMAAENSANGYIRGWEHSEARVQATLRRIMGSVGSTTARVLQIQSPSKVMRKLGQFTAEGFALGIADNETLVTSAATHMAGGAVNIDTGSAGSAQTARKSGPTVTLNLPGAVIRSDEDARTLARTLGGYIQAMNYGV